MVEKITYYPAMEKRKKKTKVAENGKK